MAAVAIRRLTAEDAVALTAFVERARDRGDLLGSSAPHGEWVVRYVLLEPGQVAVATDTAGSMVGLVLPEGKALVVEPDHRRQGVGRALVDEALTIERERDRPNLFLGRVPDDGPGQAFLEATGFAFHSTLWDLDLEPDVAVPKPDWPDGTRARPMDADRDLPAFVDLFNAAFADHPTPLKLDADRLKADPTDAPFLGDDLVLLEAASGELVGFCTSEPKRLAEGGVEARGEIWTLGVRPSHQGRGYGRELLRWGIDHLRGLGVATVTLSVNGRNPRALGLYESHGFRRTSTRERWARPVGGASGELGGSLEA